MLLLCWHLKEPISCQTMVSEIVEKEVFEFEEIRHIHTDTHRHAQTHTHWHRDSRRHTCRDIKIHTETYTDTQTHIMKCAKVKVNQNESTVARDHKWIPRIYTIWTKARIQPAPECSSIYFIVEKFPREAKCLGQGPRGVKGRNHSKCLLLGMLAL